MILREIKYYLKSVLNSYSVIFFSDKYFFSVILIIVSFFDIFAGLLGLISVAVSITAANILGFDKLKIEKGFYGFNSLLVGLGVGLHYEMSWIVVFVMIFASLFSLFVTVSLEGVLGKYFLPYLSLPFLISFWLISLATKELQFLALSSRGLYFMDEMVLLGGSRLLSIVQWWGSFELFDSLKYYFISMGAIFFQYSVLSGILVSAGLLLFSRIAFSLSLLGFYIAFFIYQMMGTTITDVGYSYVGFNYILTAIAIGGYFLVPSKSSYLWVVILIPLTVLLTIALSSIFSIWHLHIYSLTFNIIVLTFLYILKQRVFKSPGLTEVIYQQDSPESNLYNYLNNNHRFRNYSYFSVRLPFFGQWVVSQGHNGDVTHKENWRHAWDFVIKDSDGHTHNTPGTKLMDYYCYGKVVLAPMDGYVEEIIDGIPDNEIGDVNVENNWGNTIIIRHNINLYSKLSHLKPGSFKVTKGEMIKTGQLIASCGSSGRSPEPHLHFQLQATPLIDGETVDYPIAQYIKKNGDNLEYISFDRPRINDTISNVEVNSLMKEAFHFIPGQKLKFETEHKGKIKEVNWEVITDIYNYTYLYCKESNSFAYFFNDERIFYFYKFSGNKKSLLYNFFLSAYKAPLGFYENLKIRDSLAVNLTYSYLGLFMQDFIAPFFMFLKSDFKLEYLKMDNIINTSEITLRSSVSKSFFKYETGHRDFEININKNGIQNFIIKHKNKKIISTCIK